MPMTLGKTEHDSKNIVPISISSRVQIGKHIDGSFAYRLWGLDFLHGEVCWFYGWDNALDAEQASKTEPKPTKIAGIVDLDKAT